MILVFFLVLAMAMRVLLVVLGVVVVASLWLLRWTVAVLVGLVVFLVERRRSTTSTTPAPQASVSNRR